MGLDNQAGRQTWIDFAKGWGILLVVFGHAVLALRAPGLISKSGLSVYVEAFIYSFHMPLFMFLSGIFIEKSLKKPLKNALSSRFSAVAWPYLVWSILQSLIQLQVSSVTNSPMKVSQIYSILWTPVMQFWFLHALFLLCIIWILIRKLGVSKWGLFVVFVLLRLVP